MILTRADWEKIETTLYAPYAVKSGESRGRKYPEKEHPTRSVFQRDRDRIIHSTAFRRLEYKTQVFIYHEGDYYRNRLTHTIEVQQIARTIARSLRLNEDLVEAIALAHDIGHTPFGHKGEWSLNEIMKKFNMSFEHNRHGLRVVDELEKRYRHFDGLNLSYEVREGIVKHKTSYDNPHHDEFEESHSPCLEAQVVNFADEIAYTSHDVDDGLKSGIIEWDQLKEVPLWKLVTARLDRDSRKDPELARNACVRHLINLLVSDLLEASEKRLKCLQPASVDQVRAADTMITYSSGTGRQYAALRKFLEENMYNHYRVIRMAAKADRIIRDLFEAYEEEPRQIPPHVFNRIGKEPKEQIICDYIAGMTDRFAQEEHRRLFSPESLV